MVTSVEKKIVKTTFVDNFRSSRPEVFSNIWENSKENILGEVFLSSKYKKNVLPRIFSRILQNNRYVEHFRLPVFLIC